MIISKNEVFVLLNHQIMRGITEIPVMYPPLESELFTLNLQNMKIENLLSHREFERIRRKYAENGFLKRELPDPHDMLDIFISSTVADFENRDEIEENFDLLRRAVNEKTMYVKPVFIGIDTNIAYYRVISRRLKNHFKYALSNIVVGEIDAKIHSKYSGREIRELSQLPYGKVMNEFVNGSVKESRKAKNAMNEIYHLTNRLDAFIIGKRSETLDKEVRDREIVRQYSKFSDEINAEVILLTADKDMVFHAQAEQLSSIYFKLPHSYQDSYIIDPQSISYLIYDLTLVFGIIKIGDDILLGEWRGKTSEDYFNEKLKLYNTPEDVAKDLKICRGVMNELQGA